MSNDCTLIIGGSGFLGRAVVQAARRDRTVVETHRSSPTNSWSRMFDALSDDPAQILADVAPKTVIFAAHIEPGLTEESARTHTEQLISQCANTRFIYVSSDAIFDGKKGRYHEDDLPIPVTDYGRGLHFMETMTRRYCPDHVIVRFSYLYGCSAGTLDPRLSAARETLSRGDELLRFSDMYKSPLEVNEAATYLLTVHGLDFTGTIHIAGPRISVFDFYKDALTKMGVQTDRLGTETIPPNSQLLRDTSLATKRLEQLTKTRPRTVSQALTCETSRELSG